MKKADTLDLSVMDDPVKREPGVVFSEAQWALLSLGLCQKYKAG